MNKKKIIDKLLIVSIVVMAVSGFLIRPTGEMMAVIVMHKLSLLLFLRAGEKMVCVQYKTKKRRESNMFL
ncbi:MAG: hypothetical protein ACLTKE_08890 [Coprococcus sp.]